MIVQDRILRLGDLPKKVLQSLVLLPALFILLWMPSGADDETIEALYVTGGGWHDYETQKEIIPPGLEERLDISVEINHVEGGKQAPEKHPAYRDENWAKGYDVIVHNMCNASNLDDSDFVKKVVRPHAEGKPGVFIHCAMHNFRRDSSRRWQKMLGLTTYSHEKKHPITVTVRKPEHPIMRNVPENWTTPKGELYRDKSVSEDTTVLATGVAGEEEKRPVVWTHTYKKGRIFATTIGHHNETVRTDEFLNLISRGLLWATEELTPSGD